MVASKRPLTLKEMNITLALAIEASATSEHKLDLESEPDFEEAVVTALVLGVQ